jgi:hypothetical protein
METTMTKIKDLVTVTVDNVFRLFPVDDERYELVAQVIDVKECLFQGGFSQTAITTDNDRIKMFLSQTLENFAMGASALLRYRLCGPREVLPPIVCDRAKRAALSMNEYDSEVDLCETPEENTRLWLWCLWSSFSDQLRDMHVVRNPAKLSRERALWSGFLEGMKSGYINGVPKDR